MPDPSPPAPCPSSPLVAADHEFIEWKSPITKHILGQAAWQLGVLGVLIFRGPELLGIADHADVAGASVHFTLVFNTFVLMQARGMHTLACIACMQ